MSELIRTEALGYHYPGRMILDGVDFALRSDERVSLEGQNGAGKTTFLNLLVGLNKPKSGRIIAFGAERSTEQSFHDVRARAGYLFQDSDDQLFCPTVLEDVAFGPLNLGKTRDEAEQIAHSTLECLGLAGFGERITYQLSGGEKRMVSLASVLAMEPEVLLLDEPSTGLDDEARDRLITVLRHLPQAMILISHERDFLEALVSRRTRLTDGKIIDV